MYYDLINIFLLCDLENTFSRYGIIFLHKLDFSFVQYVSANPIPVFVEGARLLLRGWTVAEVFGKPCFRTPLIGCRYARPGQSGYAGTFGMIIPSPTRLGDVCNCFFCKT